MKMKNSRKLTLVSIGAVVAVAIAAFAAASLWRSGASTSAEIQEQLPPMVVRAVFADRRLWLLHANGLLASMRQEAGEPEPLQEAGSVADICQLGGRLIVVTHEDIGERWLIRSRTASAWGSSLAVPTGGEALIAFDCEGGRMTLVTSRRLIEVMGNEARTTPLSEAMESMEGPPATSTAHVDDEAVWIGFNAGEWGGGLVRIARDKGHVEWVERNRSGGLCGGPLNRQCDPVTGIVASPWRPSCVVATIGLVHMMPHGRIVQVCGTNVQRIYFKPLDPQPPNLTLDEGEPPSTVAFFGLARKDNALWSIGIDGIYRFSGSRVEFSPLPRFQTRGSYLVSFDIPGVALVMTGSNQRTSMSGSTPVMAIR